MLDLIFAAGPIILLIYLMTRRRALPSHQALPVAAVVTYLVRLMWFSNDPTLIHASVVSGLLRAWTPILIVWGAVLLFRTMEQSGAMDVVRKWLSHVTDHPVAQLMIVGWAFAFMIEGASGFGTPAALAAPLLVGMGFPAVRVAVLALVMNSVPVSFGAVGTPIWFGLEPLGLNGEDLLAVSWRVGLLQTFTSLLVPLLALSFVVPWRVVLRNLVFVYLSILSCVLPMLALALINYEFPALVGGLIGLLLSVFMARHKIGLAAPEPDGGADQDRRSGPAGSEDAQPVGDEDEGLQVGGGALLPSMDDADSQRRVAEARPSPKTAPATQEEDSGITTGALIKALFPLWGVVLLLVVTRVKQLGLRSLLQAESPAWDVTLGTVGEFSISASLVAQLQQIFGTSVVWKHAILYVPSIVPFFVIAAITWFLYRVPPRQAGQVFMQSWRSLTKPIIALMAALVFVELLMVEQTGADGVRASTTIIGASMASLFGGAWPLVAPFLGELGAFFSGSATISNLTFGQVQAQAAAELQLDRYAILAQQATGAAMGNMVCIHNIVAVCSVLGLLASQKAGEESVEGFILKRTVIPAVLAGLLVGLVGAVMQLL